MNTAETLTAPGTLTPNLPREQYDRLQRVNWSTLKNMGRSAAHYRHALTNPREDTDAMRIGRCVHLAAFEPERYAAEVAVWKDGVRRGKKWDAFCTKNAGREILTEKDNAGVLRIANAARGDAVAAKYLAGGKGELTIQWALTAANEERVECKGRIDFLADCGAIVDLKTTRDASPDGFGKSCWSLGYHAQAAFYADGYEAATGERLPFVVVAVENVEPFVVQVYRVPDEVLEVGREHYQNLLNAFAEFRRQNRWPGYFDGEGELTLPKWALPSEDENADALGLVFGDEE